MDQITCHLLGPDTAHLLVGAKIFDNPVDPDHLNDFIDDPSHLLIFACYGARVVGFVSGTLLRHPDKPPALFINEVAVAADLRRHGIASTLCTRMMDFARDQGCRGIWLATEADNVAARDLYRHLGARETDAVVIYDWDGAMDP